MGLLFILVGGIFGGIITYSILKPNISEINDLQSNVEEMSNKIQVLESERAYIENVLRNMTDLRNGILNVQNDYDDIRSVIEVIDVKIVALNKIIVELIRPKLMWYMEDNALNDFTKGGDLQYNSPYSVLSEVTQSGSDWIQSEIVDPTRSYTGASVTRAQALRWADNENEQRLDDYTDVYSGVRIYLPSDFDVPDDPSSNHWCLIYQLHEQGGDGIFMALLVNRDGTFKIGHSKVEDGRLVGYTIADDIPGIYGRSFTVIAHVRSTVDGIVEVWIDGVKVAQDVGDHSASDPGAKPGPFFSVGLYQNVDSNSKYMLFRDGVMASTYQDIETYLSSTT